MTERKPKSSATEFLDSNAELRRAMCESKVFDRIKLQAAFQIDGEQLYIVKSDALGGEDDLFLDALAEGSRQGATDELRRALFLELDDAHRESLNKRFGKL